MAQQIVIEVPGTKISELEKASSISRNDVTPVVQDDETKQAEIGQIADLVISELGSAALKNESDFATPSAVTEAEAASQARDDAQNERIDSVEHGLVSIGSGADASFSTYAEMIAYVPPKANVSVRNNDPDPALRGVYTWTGTQYVDGYDPLDASIEYINAISALTKNATVFYPFSTKKRNNISVSPVSAIHEQYLKSYI
ncbi:TPA: SGNH/GDSL hydrolase family protein, partial [Acinetobacter baumannii]|nr:SGNH/GDSL hydrolase family protein [Acinetobacter baumannii]